MALLHTYVFDFLGYLCLLCLDSCLCCYMTQATWQTSHSFFATVFILTTMAFFKILFHVSSDAGNTGSCLSLYGSYICYHFSLIMTHLFCVCCMFAWCIIWRWRFWPAFPLRPCISMAQTVLWRFGNTLISYYLSSPLLATPISVADWLRTLMILLLDLVSNNILYLRFLANCINMYVFSFTKVFTQGWF